MRAELDLTYSGTYGTLKVQATDFLPLERIRSLVDMDQDSILSALSQQAYASDISALSGKYKGYDLLEMSINRRLAHRNYLVLRSCPGQVRDFIQFYLSKWDIENIKTIISAKAVGYDFSISDPFIVSFRGIPMAMFGGIIPYEVYRSITQLGGIEQMVESIAQYFSGKMLLANLEIYKKHRDTSMFFSAVDNYFYTQIVNFLKYYRGDEWIVRNYFSDLISLRNVEIVIKGKALGLDYDLVRSAITNTTSIGDERLMQLFSGSLDDLTQLISNAFSVNLPQGVTTPTEATIAIYYGVTERYLSQMSSTTSSLNYIMWYLLKSEMERMRLKGIVNGKRYGLDRKTIMMLTGMN